MDPQHQFLWPSPSSVPPGSTYHQTSMTYPNMYPPPPVMYNTPTGPQAPGPKEAASQIPADRFPASHQMVTNMAMEYGTQLMGTGKEMVDKEVGKYVSMARLKYYFAVDTSYVFKKISLLLFPFFHTDWSLKHIQNVPLEPRQDINAPDLYIPAMAYITYVLVAGLVLGTQDRFTPEILGILASQAMAWSLVEIVIELITLYVINIQCNLKTLDLLAYSGYKFIGIIISILCSLALSKQGYYLALLCCSISLAFFLIRTLKYQILLERTGGNNIVGGYIDPSQATYSVGYKRRMYFILSVAFCQPILMWWLSYHLVSS